MNTHTLSRQTLFDTLHRSASRHPEKLALRQGGRDLSYREFRDLCLSVAGSLAHMGIQPGDRVAILSRNSIDFAAVRYAVAAIGAILVPVNFMLNVRETAYILGHSGARLLCVGATEGDKAVAAAAECPDIEQLVWLAGGNASDTPAGMIPFGDLCSGGHYTDNPGIDANAPAQIIYTSGTESAPKGAVLSHAAILWQYSACSTRRSPRKTPPCTPCPCSTAPSSIVSSGLHSRPVAAISLPMTTHRPTCCACWRTSR